MKDDGNYNIDSLSDIFIENQGSWIVQVNHFTLLPGDVLKVLKRDMPHVSIRLRIRFLQAYSFNLPIAAFPSLYNGKRILVSWIPKHD